MFIDLVEISRNTLWLKGVKGQLVSESDVLSSSYASKQHLISVGVSSLKQRNALMLTSSASNFVFCLSFFSIKEERMKLLSIT
jgi:hypothetical protein